MNQTARHASAMSRRVPPARVLYIELTEFIMNTDPVVRQSERATDTPNRTETGAGGGLASAAGAAQAPTAAGGAPLELIAASLRRERRRTGLSLTEVARRAGIAKSTLSQLESGTGNPSLETLWAICVALDAPFSRLLDPPRPRVQVIRARGAYRVGGAGGLPGHVAGRLPAGGAAGRVPDLSGTGVCARVAAAHAGGGRARRAQRGAGACRCGGRAGGARTRGLPVLPG